MVPLGIPSLVKDVAPPDARSKLLPDVTYSIPHEPMLDITVYGKLTAEKDVNATPLPHENDPLLTPQFPFEEVIVKLELDPEIV